jgi:hypothetical protein
MDLSELTLDDLNFIANALRVAAEEYAKHAAAFAGEHRNPTHRSLHEQFTRQAERARELATQLEEA